MRDITMGQRYRDATKCDVCNQKTGLDHGRPATEILHNDRVYLLCPKCLEAVRITESLKD